jgi:lysophospholipase L1-like esterase
MRNWMIVFACSALFAQDFALRDGERVVFYGDSITDQRMYTVAVETFAVTRFPERKIAFTHSGWGGDRVSGGGGGTIEERLRRDVFPYGPTRVTVMLGMNDGRYRAHEEAIFQNFATGYEKLLGLLKTGAPEARVTLIRPSPFDDVTQPPRFAGGYNAVLVKYGEFLAGVAQKQGHELADLNAGVVAMLEKANRADAGTAQKIIPDRVHPGWGGHLIMAAELLKAWNAPALVTAVEIDAGANRVLQQENTAVSDWRAQGGLYTWTQKDRALPMPPPSVPAAEEPAVKLAVASSDFYERLNQQTLRVRGIFDGRYMLKINGKPVGTFAVSDLAAGVNLAKLETPMLDQARAVQALTVKRTNVHQLRWRQLQVPLEKDGLGRLRTILENIDALDAEIAVRQRAAAVPVQTYYELVREN